MKQRKTSNFAPTASRESSRVRRSPLAPVARFSDDAAIATLVGHHVAKLAGKPGAPARLSSYSHSLRSRGHGELVTLVNGALYGSAGSLLRDLARVTKGDARRRGLVVRAAVDFVRVVHEHNARSHAARLLILRSMLQGVLVDDALASTVGGTATDEDARRLTRLDGSARLNLAMALQVAATTPPEAFADRAGGDDPLALVRARHAQRARDALPVDAEPVPRDEPKGGP